jgi:chromosome segregation ATPase
MEATWGSRPFRHEGRSLMTLTQELVIAMLATIGAAITGLLSYLAATRNSARQVAAQRATDDRVEDEKRDALLASVHKEAADSGRALYQQLCSEQQARIAQQHVDLMALSADVQSLRTELDKAQTEMSKTRHELFLTQDELRQTRLELQDTRVLLQSTKDELISSRSRQTQLETECDSLRVRVKDLETELKKYQEGG